MAINTKRRNYFTKPDVQGHFILVTFVMVCICCVLYAAMFANFSTDSMTITYKDNNLTLGKTPIVLFKEMLKAQGLFILFGGFGAAILAMLISHRFTGPLFKLETFIKSMTEGDHALTLYFRPKDKTHELAALINLYNDKFSKEIYDMRVTTEALSEKLAQFDVSKPDSAKNNVAEAVQLASQLQEKLQQYKIRS